MGGPLKVLPILSVAPRLDFGPILVFVMVHFDLEVVEARPNALMGKGYQFLNVILFKAL
jgi:hypothetical protein